MATIELKDDLVRKIQGIALIAGTTPENFVNKVLTDYIADSVSVPTFVPLYDIKFGTFKKDGHVSSVKLVRSLTGFLLKDAADIVNEGKVFLKGLTLQKCQQIADAFTEIGSTVQFLEQN